jgi:hypothetical protein
METSYKRYRGSGLRHRHRLRAYPRATAPSRADALSVALPATGDGGSASRRRRRAARDRLAQSSASAKARASSSASSWPVGARSAPANLDRVGNAVIPRDRSSGGRSGHVLEREQRSVKSHPTCRVARHVGRKSIPARLLRRDAQVAVQAEIGSTMIEDPAHRHHGNGGPSCACPCRLIAARGADSPVIGMRVLRCAACGGRETEIRVTAPSKGSG